MLYKPKFKHDDDNYQQRFRIRNVYRAATFCVTLYDNPRLQIKGETMCGLKYILNVDESCTLYLYVQKTYKDCSKYRPNYIAYLKDFDVIDQRVIYDTCYDNGFCSFSHAQHSPENQWHEELYDTWKVEPRYKLDGELNLNKRTLTINS